MERNFPKSLAFVLACEGGYVNHPSDRGGETNMGITRAAYPDEDIRNLTVERAGELYKRDYWDRVRGDQLPSGVDYVVFDSAVNHGVGNAGKFLQRALNRYGANLNVDGIIGPQTIRKIPAGNGMLACDILRERDIFYRKIVAQDRSQEIFLKGWLNRLARVSENVKEFV